ncbi:MAG: hypothetical protein ACXWP5_03225 [Bdellovibrionota bacterium]
MIGLVLLGLFVAPFASAEPKVVIATGEVECAEGGAPCKESTIPSLEKDADTQARTEIANSEEFKRKCPKGTETRFVRTATKSFVRGSSLVVQVTLSGFCQQHPVARSAEQPVQADQKEKGGGSVAAGATENQAGSDRPAR